MLRYRSASRWSNGSSQSPLEEHLSSESDEQVEELESKDEECGVEILEESGEFDVDTWYVSAVSGVKW